MYMITIDVKDDQILGFYEAYTTAREEKTLFPGSLGIELVESQDRQVFSRY